MMKLAQTAEKVVGLTGTLYGGVASSLYGLRIRRSIRACARTIPGASRARRRGCGRWARLERIVEYRPEYDKGGHYTGKRRVEHKPKEAPGCSPLLVREIIDHTVFVGLQDIGRDMPEFEEIPVPIPMDADMELHYKRAKDKLSTYLFQCRMEGDASFPRALPANAAGLADCAVPGLRRSFTNAASTARVTSSSKSRCMTCRAWVNDRLYPKEQWLVELVRDELAQGRNVGVFLRQTRHARHPAAHRTDHPRACARRTTVCAQGQRGSRTPREPGPAAVGGGHQCA